MGFTILRGWPLGSGIPKIYKAKDKTINLTRLNENTTAVSGIPRECNDENVIEKRKARAGWPSRSSFHGGPGSVKKVDAGIKSKAGPAWFSLHEAHTKDRSESSKLSGKLKTLILEQNPLSTILLRLPRRLTILLIIKPFRLTLIRRNLLPLPQYPSLLLTLNLLAGHSHLLKSLPRLLILLPLCTWTSQDTANYQLYSKLPPTHLRTHISDANSSSSSTALLISTFPLSLISTNRSIAFFSSM